MYHYKQYTLHVMAALMIAVPIQAMFNKKQPTDDDVPAPISQFEEAMLNPEELEEVLRLERQYFQGRSYNGSDDHQFDQELSWAFEASLSSNEAGPSDLSGIEKRCDKAEVRRGVEDSLDEMFVWEAVDNIADIENFFISESKEEMDTFQSKENADNEFELGYFSDEQPIDIKKEIEQLLVSDLPKSKGDIEDDMQRIASYEDALRSNDSLRQQLKLRWLRNAISIVDNLNEKRDLQQQLRKLQADMRCKHFGQK